ncbi:hypothetical protein [Nocardia amamiensis]|uniref:hypothetical protein n=1 Tax=Nocardia amamiensis TaxID=404578 RepID=UPI0008362DFC|nr:hypothetical protein [Nocardia amamiensis]
MPTVLHEVIIDLFRQRPRLAADLLALVMDSPLPEFDHARLESGDFPDIDPTEYRADAVVVLANGTDPALGVIIEVQLRPDLVMAVLPKAARHFLESLMTTGTYEYKSEFARRYYSRGKAEGRAEGEAAALLRILRTRGFTMSEAIASRIAECTDLDQINIWIDRAVTADSLDEILAEHPKP